MPLSLPDFKTTRCRRMGLCGFLKRAGVTGSATKEPKTMVAQYTIGRSSGYIGLTVGGEQSKHFHLDIWKRGVLKAPPKTTATREKIETLVEKFAGESLYLRAFGSYVVPIDALPEEGLVRSNLLDLSEDGLTIKQSGAKFTIDGAPISQIVWTLSDDAKSAEITVESIGEATISPNYILEQLAVLDSGFATFVLGKEKVGKD